MFKDVDAYLLNCECCQALKGNYVGPKTQLGSLLTKQPLELLCIDFTKADPSKCGKENIWVLTDAFTKCSQAFVTNNQKALTVVKILVDKWFNVYGIPSRIHSDLGRPFDNEIISNLCKMYGMRQSTTTLYNPCGNSQCEWFNWTLFGLLKSLNNEKKTKLALTPAIFGFCIQCNSSFNYWFSTIWVDVWAQGTNALQCMAQAGPIPGRPTCW